MTEQNRTLYSIQEAAKTLGFRDQTIRNWTARGWLLHVQLPNGRKGIPVSEIERLSRPVQGVNS